MANNSKCKSGCNGVHGIVHIPQRPRKEKAVSASDMKKLMEQVRKQYEGVSREDFIRAMRSKYHHLRLSASDFGKLYDQLYPNKD